MKRYALLAFIIVLASCLVGGILQSVESTQKWSTAEFFAAAKPGQWVELRGVIQADLSVQATEFKFLSSGLGDDDWELEAKVLAVTPVKSEFQVLSVPVRVVKSTKLNKPIKSVADIKPEMLIRLEGTYLSEGAFQAKDVANTTAKLKDNPQLDTMIEAVGKISQVDEARQMITVMGIPFYLAEKKE